MAISVAIVDDEASLCRSLGRLLRQAGMQSNAFMSAEEFLASPLQGRFDCLLLDVQLDGMSGLELHRRMLEEGDRTPVIYITAQDEAAIEAEAKRMGCARFFRKADAGIRIIEALRAIAADKGQR